MTAESKKFWLDDATEKILDNAKALITPEWIETNIGQSDDLRPWRIIHQVFLWAAFEALRREWYETAEHAGLQVELEVAKQMMHEEHFRHEAEHHNVEKLDPIIGRPGMVATIFKIDGSDAIAYEYTMTGLMPMSAYYTNKVRESIDTAAMVGARIEAARKKLEGVNEVEVVVETEANG